MSNPSGKQTENEFVISRVFDFPRIQVFKAWTELESLKKWWGPKGFAVTSGSLDLRPGGLFHYCLENPKGGTMWGKFVFREITAPERLVYVSSFSDEKANTVRAPFDIPFPLEILSTLTFAEQKGKTTLTLRSVPVNAAEHEVKAFVDLFKSMQQGWGGTLEQLADYLESIQ